MVAGDVYGWRKNSINQHPQLAADLALAGVDVVSLANNHCMDRGHVGVQRTINACEAGGLLHFGTRRDSSTCDGWYTITHKNGRNVAWVGCTDTIRSKRGHNRVSDKQHQILFCKSSIFLPLVRLLSKRPGIDAVIATVHWGGHEDTDDSAKQRGACYSTRVTASMRGFAKAIVDAGAATVLGSHPHVLMEWETYESEGRRALIAYSLGNAISRQGFGSGPAMNNCQHSQGISADECRHRLLSHAMMFFNFTWTTHGPNVSCFSYVETAFTTNLMMEEVVSSARGKQSHADTVLGSRWRTAPEQLTCFPLESTSRRRRREGPLLSS